MYDIIHPILQKTYGGATGRHYVERCATDVAYKLEKGSDEREITLTLWDWFSGGATANSTARQIFEAIS